MSPLRRTGSHQQETRRADPEHVANGTESPDKEDAAGIPWRTSRRLQEATYKIFQGRDVGQTNDFVPIKKEKSPLPQVQSMRSLKRQHSPSNSADVDTDGGERADEKTSAADLRSYGKRRRVSFSDPLFVIIDDQKQTSPSSSERSSDSPCERKPQQSVDRTSNFGIQAKQPMSCFDLLCNHVGPKGWRCYRACVPGESFCNHHKSQKVSIVRIPVCS